MRARSSRVGVQTLATFCESEIRFLTPAITSMWQCPQTIHMVQVSAQDVGCGRSQKEAREPQKVQQGQNEIFPKIWTGTTPRHAIVPSCSGLSCCAEFTRLLVVPPSPGSRVQDARVVSDGCLQGADLMGSGKTFHPGAVGRQDAHRMAHTRPFEFHTMSCLVRVHLHLCLLWIPLHQLPLVAPLPASWCILAPCAAAAPETDPFDMGDLLGGTPHYTQPCAYLPLPSMPSGHTRLPNPPCAV